LSTDIPPWDAPETAEFWPAGYDRIVLEETDSTMKEAARRAADLRGPTWIMARRQTAAHGRRGRPWQSPEGNFAATLFLRPSEPPAAAALRSFIAAVALFQTLNMCRLSGQLSLKWPNDVLLNDGKVAGILLESAGRGPGLDWMSIGVGVNLLAAPDTSDVEARAVRPVSVAGQGGQPHSQDEMLFWLASHFAQLETLFAEFGFDPIRRLWLRHATRLGEVITARTARDEITGTFETVDEAGNLVLSTAKQRHAIPAAEIFF
jgi:BirA family biotin operon repressor/biotin-[acetyl-CoA-carboxylase] ligase